MNAALLTGEPPDVRRRRVEPNGAITWYAAGRPRHIGVGRVHAGSLVTVLARDCHLRIMSADGHLLRELTLDLTRDYQPSGAPAGRPQGRRAGLTRKA